MSQRFRWAARYALMDELWRDRARIVHDPHLEAVLLQGEPDEPGTEGVGELLDALVPRRHDGPAVWMAVSSAEVAARLARAHPGATFLPVEGLTDVVRRADWDVALVHLEGSMLADDPGDGDRLSERGRALVAELGPRLRSDRTAVVSVPVRDAAGDRDGLDYADAADVLAEELGGGRILGLYTPPIVAAAELGDRIDADDDEGYEVDLVEDAPTGEIVLDPEQDDADADADADADDVPLSFDNTLGSQEPALVELVMVAGAGERDLPEGLSLVELPPTDGIDEGEPRPRERGGDLELAPHGDAEALGAVRVQLAQARREADLAAIDRQAQIERLGELQRTNAALEREVGGLRDALARAVMPGPGSSEEGSGDAEARPDPGERLDAALAREQSLRWRVGQLEQELAHAIARPVEELEAEVAGLRARLARAEAPGDRVPPGDDVGAVAPPDPSAPAEAPAADAGAASPGPGRRNGGGRPRNGRDAHRVSGAPASSGSSVAPATVAVIAAMEGLLRRIERGGIGTLQLRRELVALQRRLRA